MTTTKFETNVNIPKPGYGKSPSSRSKWSDMLPGMFYRCKTKKEVVRNFVSAQQYGKRQTPKRTFTARYIGDTIGVWRIK